MIILLENEVPVDDSDFKSCATCTHCVRIAPVYGLHGQYDPGETYCDQNVWRGEVPEEMDFCTLFEKDNDQEN